MSAQILSDRKTRKIARATGQEVLRAWGHGGYVFGFVTPDHRHGSYDSRSNEWQINDRPLHYTSCHELFPDWVPESMALPSGEPLEGRVLPPGEVEGIRLAEWMGLLGEEVRMVIDGPEVRVIVRREDVGDDWIIARDAE